MCIVQHRLVNCLHDGKERLAIFQHKVAQYLQQGVAKKPAGFGDPSKVSTQTCQVCLQDPKTYNQKSSLAAAPVMFEDIKEYSCSPMHMWMVFLRPPGMQQLIVRLAKLNAQGLDNLALCIPPLL